MLIVLLALALAVWVLTFIRGERQLRAQPVAVIDPRELRAARQDPRVRAFLANADAYGAACERSELAREKRAARRTAPAARALGGSSAARGRGRSPR